MSNVAAGERLTPHYNRWNGHVVFVWNCIGASNIASRQESDGLTIFATPKQRAMSLRSSFYGPLERLGTCRQRHRLAPGTRSRCAGGRRDTLMHIVKTATVTLLTSCIICLAEDRPGPQSTAGRQSTAAERSTEAYDPAVIAAATKASTSTTTTTNSEAYGASISTQVKVSILIRHSITLRPAPSLSRFNVRVVLQRRLPSGRPAWYFTLAG